jgi:hypothetical protein
MTRFIAILLLFFCQVIFCQEYHFDYFIEYKNQERGGISSYFINSNESNYFLSRYDNDGTNFEARLYEKNSDLIHFFELKNLSNSVQITYKETQPRKKSNYINNYFIETNIEIINDSLKKIFVYAYSNKKKKRFSRKMEVLFDNTDVKISKEIFNHFFHGTLIDREIEYPNGIPTKVNIVYENGNKVEYTLTQKKQINTTIKANN